MDEDNSKNIPMINRKLSSDNTLSEDTLRYDEPWTTKSENYLKDIMKNCKNLSNIHENSGYYLRRKTNIFSIPSIIIPTIMSPLTTIFGDYEYMKYINMTAFLITGFLTAINNYYKFSNEMEQHFQFSNKYSIMYNEIDLELSKKKKYRIDVDVFTEKIKNNYDHLFSTAPIIPEKYNIYYQKNLLIV